MAHDQDHSGQDHSGQDHSGQDHAGQDHAGVRFPPPLIFVGFLLIGLAIAWPGGFGVPLWLRIAAAVLVTLSGGVIVGLAAGVFRHAGEQPEPWTTTRDIIADGIYAATRNPMYLGMATIQAGLAIAADSVAALVLVPVAMLVVQWTVIAREEAYLTAKFGDAYRAYQDRVRRWF